MKVAAVDSSAHFMRVKAFVIWAIRRRYVVVLVIVSLVLWIGVASTAWSQFSCDSIYTFTGEAADDYFGNPVCGAGDVNNDGFDDLIVGAHINDAGGNDAGRVYVYSGANGTLLYTFTGEGAGDCFGWGLSGAGDVNNDGFDDLIVGASGKNIAYVYSGANGDLLYTFTGGVSVSGAGDVNNDGFDDLIVGPIGNNTDVYSGATGALLHTFTAEAAGDWFGWSVSGAGDVDNDGHTDLIVGAPQNKAGGWYAGRAYVYSGRYGALLYTFTGEAANDGLGRAVSGAGDVNNDGFDDLIVGADGNDAGGIDAGRVYVYSGANGALLHTFTAEAAGDWLGASVSGAGDVNNDGFDDLIVGAPKKLASGRGRAHVYSGATGTVLQTFTGESMGDYFGISVSGAGDVNNDGFDDVIVGAIWNDAGGQDAGRAYVYTCLSVGVSELSKVATNPSACILGRNIPNPFTHRTTIWYQLSAQSQVSLKVFSLTGQLVQTLVNGEKEVGHYTADWYGKNAKDQRVAPGVYFCKLEVEGHTETRKMVLLR